MRSPAPLSRAERILISHLKRRAFAALTELEKTAGMLGAIPDSQGIADAHCEARKAVGRFIVSLRLRKHAAGCEHGEADR